MDMAGVELSDLRFRWTRTGPLILDIDAFAVEAGARIFLRGPSGSGKTTLLNVIGGVATPQTGRIRIGDTEITKLSPAARDRFRAERIGFIFQQFNLVPYLGLIENVTLPCRFSAQRRDKATANRSLDQEARRLLTHMQLDPAELAGRPVATLSVGQQQRVAAARALVGSPDLIVADEPTSSIDADAREAFLNLLFDETKRTGATVIFVSHDTGLTDMFDRTVDLASINRAAPTQKRAA
ncbi:MAG: ABC transporter ATP-binding protein [Pseudomonadota bacterium]